jgi:hypothetical protein
MPMSLYYSLYCYKCLAITKKEGKKERNELIRNRTEILYFNDIRMEDN